MIRRLVHRPRSGLWNHPDYLRLWSAQGISAFGSQTTLLALPLVAILMLDASPFEVAALTAVEFLPFIFVSIPAGVWIDRLRRRPILIFTDIARALSLISIPLAYALDLLALPHLYVIGFVNGVLTVFFVVAYQAYLPLLVDREQLVDANAKFEATETLARLGGPASAGGLVALLTAPITVLVDALSYLASGALVYSIKHQEPNWRRTGDPAATATPFRLQLLDGGRFALRDPYIRAILASTAVINVGFNVVWAILLVYAVRELDLGAGVVGLVLSAGEVGGLIGAAATRHLTRRAGPGRVVVGAAALFAPSLLILAAAPRATPFPFLIAGWAIVSFASVVYNSTTVGLRQARVPQSLQGRVVGFNRTVVWGVSPLGALLGGALAASIGFRFAIAVGAAIAAAAVVPAVLSPLRSLRHLPDIAEEELELPDHSLADGLNRGRPRR